MALPVQMRATTGDGDTNASTVAPAPVEPEGSAGDTSVTGWGEVR